MIEMMCRDGGTPVELLDQAACVVEESIGCPVDLLDIDDHRAMVYWGPSDVASAIKELGIKEIDAEDMSLCADLLCDFEVNIHQAMLEAGHDALQSCLECLVDELRKQDEESK